MGIWAQQKPCVFADQQVDLLQDMSQTGTVKKFFEDKGFGSITGNDGEDFFIHVKELNGAESLTIGDTVSFDTKWDDRKGKYQACNCTSSGGGGGGGGGYNSYGGGKGGGKDKGKGGKDKGYS